MRAVRRYWPLGVALLVGFVTGVLAATGMGPNAASLDPTLQTAIVFVLGITVAGALAVVTAVVTSANQAAATRRDRLDDRRIDQAVQFLRLSQAIRDQQDRQFRQWQEVARHGGPPSAISATVDDTDELQNVVRTLSLVAEQRTADAAAFAMIKVLKMEEWAYDAATYGTGAVVEGPKPNWNDDRANKATEFVVARAAFINAMREEFDQKPYV